MSLNQYIGRILSVVVFTSVSIQVFADPIIAYITDIEGSRLRFEQFLRQSEAFELGPDGRYHLRENAQFVFGGDAPDRYVGSRWVVAELVRLKLEIPDRVALILGNRDINKMRLTSELSASALARAPVRFFFTKEEEWKKHQGPESAAERLKYIFGHTMGAPQAFEARREEVANDLGIKIDDVTDEEVVESFVQELAPGGAFRMLLELGQLAHRIGNTLFVHGGITLQNLGSVPGDEQIRSDLDEWIRDLNDWFIQGVTLWRAQGEDWIDGEIRSEQAWLDYPMPEPGMNSKPESVVTGRNSDAFNNPHLPHGSIVERLLEQGIQRLVIGHTPTGDYPLVLRTRDDRFEVITADNSYARQEDFASLVHFRDENFSQTLIRGSVVLEEQSFELFSELMLGHSTPLGKRFEEGLLLGRFTSDPSTLMSFRYGEKFRVISVQVKESELEGVELLEPVLTCESSFKK